MHFIQLAFLAAVAFSSLASSRKIMEHRRVAHEKIMITHQKMEHRTQRKAKTDSGYSLGPGFCQDIDTHNNATVDFFGTHDCVALCRAHTNFACHGYSSGDGICKLYASNALQAQRPALVTAQEHALGVKCYVLKQTFSADFPLTDISAADFVGCYNGIVTAAGGETQITSNLDYVHVRDGDAHGFYAGFCARLCQRFRYFLLKSHVASNERGSNKCFCVERFDHEKDIDRFVGDSYFGKKVSDAMCPPWNCVHDADGCVWQTTWSKHAAIYRTPTPKDGEACPDYQSSHEHQSSYIYISGSNGLVTSSGWYRSTSVPNPSACAEQCFREGPSVHLDSSHYNETCHGYYVYRSRHLGDTDEDFHCYLYNDPIPKTDVADYHSYDASDRSRGVWTNYLCVLRTCIEDTPCAWNAADNYRRIQGFRYTAPSNRIQFPTAGAQHCDECAHACAGNQTCAAYQCSISTNHCYIFADVRVSVDVQVSDVSLCVKAARMPECTYQNGAKAVLSGENPCRCGAEACATGDYCAVDQGFGAQCNRECPCTYAPNTPTVADQVCSTKNVTFESECALRCANETLGYPGSCSGTVCSSSATGVTVSEKPCLCGTNIHESTMCPVGSLCFTNGTCPLSCLALQEEGETVVCGSDGTEYPSRCSMPAEVTVTQTGPCPKKECGSGQTDCTCHSETCDSGATPTQCVFDCTTTNSVPNSCGCVAPCDNIESHNNVSTAKADRCGCDTTYEGYIVCDGHCFISGGTTACIKTCPSPGDCACGASVCEGDRCDTAADPPLCRPYCSEGGADCTCQKDAAFSHCTDGARCFPNADASDLCVPECVGLLADDAKCHCRGDGSEIEVCNPPVSFCSVASGESGGKCVKQKCAKGETDCICGEEACVSSDDGTTYCNPDLQKCYLNCAEGGIQTDCFCPNVEAWKASYDSDATLCLSDPDNHKSLQNSYCTQTADSSKCTNHCAETNGAVQAITACPCGVGVICSPDEYCVHTEDAETGQCLPKPISESCYNITDNSEEHLGNTAVSKACFCGGMPCPEGSFCDSLTGTCAATRILECSTEPTCGAPCRCSGSEYHVVCSKDELCMSRFSSNVLCVKPVQRCHDYPQGTAQSSLGNLYDVVAVEKQGLNTECYCGASTNAGLCGASQTCGTDRWTEECANIANY